MKHSTLRWFGVKMPKKIHTLEVKRDNIVRKERNSTRGIRFTGSPELREWCKENLKHHWYFTNPKDVFGVPNTIGISFHDGSDAMLYKLTWA